jgi:hypothetical protein
MNEQVRKGQLLLVKTPPYFEKEYFYEVISAGEKLIRASLYHSPKVKRSWTIDQFAASMDMGIIRLAKDGEAPPAVPR